MKCHKCNFNNLTDSRFCQSCGSAVIQSNKRFAQNLDDYVFVPANKSHVLRNSAIFLFIVAVLFLGFVALSNSDSSINTSNSNTEVDNSIPSVNDLAIEDGKLEWITNDLYFSGILKNNSDSVVKNVKVRIDFYKDEELTQLFDTRFVTIAGAAPNGAFTFEEQVYAHPDNKFWYTHVISSGDF